MRMTAEDVRRSAHDVAQASSTLERTARRGQNVRSLPGRVAFAISAARLGVRLLRMSTRLVRNHPVVGTLLIAGVVWGLSSPRVRRQLSGDG